MKKLTTEQMYIFEKTTLKQIDLYSPGIFVLGVIMYIFVKNTIIPYTAFLITIAVKIAILIYYSVFSVHAKLRMKKQKEAEQIKLQKIKDELK